MLAISVFLLNINVGFHLILFVLMWIWKWKTPQSFCIRDQKMVKQHKSNGDSSAKRHIWFFKSLEFMDFTPSKLPFKRERASRNSIRHQTWANFETNFKDIHYISLAPDLRLDTFILIIAFAFPRFYKDKFLFYLSKQELTILLMGRQELYNYK